MPGKFLHIFKRNSKPQRALQTKQRNHNFLTHEKSPIFHKKKKRIFHRYTNFQILSRIQKNKVYLYIILWVLIVSGVWVALYSPFLQIDSIYIYRKDAIININQAYSNVEYIRWKNLLFIDTNDIAQRLQRSQKSISNITIQTKFPNSIEIELWSYTPMLQWKTHLILSNGSIISKDSKKYSDIPEIIISKNLEEYALFWDTLNTQDIKNISLLMKEITRNILGFQIRSVKYFVTEKELMIQNQIGNIFIFDLDNDINTQIKKLAIFQRETVNINEKKYIYIDVRVPERLFLCGLESEFDCRNNIKQIYGENTFTDFLIETSQWEQ